jgi:hypothetical protein
MDQVFAPAVIPQPFPELKHLLLRRMGKGMDIWKSLHKALVIAQALLHPRLLQNNFAQPDLIRVLLALSRACAVCLPFRSSAAGRFRNAVLFFGLPAFHPSLFCNFLSVNNSTLKRFVFR